MKPDFFCPPNHDVASPEIFFQPAVEPLYDGPFPVSSRLMRGQGDNPFSPAILIDDGDVSQAAAHLVNGFGIISRIHHIIQVIHPLSLIHISEPTRLGMISY